MAIECDYILTTHRKCSLSFFLFLFLFPTLCSSAATLDDLKKLEIICFVPSHLPQGFRLMTVEITYDDVGPDENKEHRFPLYSLEYGNGRNATFSIESAREGIGDRNIMVEEDTEETEIQSPLGPMYLIYRSKGKSGRKVEIKANWVEDSNMKAEKAKDPQGHPTLGCFHGFSVTEINLDAVEKNGNQFNTDDVKPDGEWTRSPTPESKEGFMRYRVLESKGNHYKVEYQENGGGTLTTASIIEFEIEKRNIRRDGKPVTIRVLRVSSYNQK